ncbi:MAG TPA: type II toxin-antitoxin system RelE/ParE family toxin [Chitinophagaceae bacterium]
MSYNIRTTAPFEKQAKKLAKKYPSLKNDLLLLIESLEINPAQGTSLGNNFYKIRLAITSKAKGKSGGARVITFVKVINETVFLASIYDKSEQAVISDKELKWLAEVISKM